MLRSRNKKRLDEMKKKVYSLQSGKQILEIRTCSRVSHLKLDFRTSSPARSVHIQLECFASQILKSLGVGRLAFRLVCLPAEHLILYLQPIFSGQSQSIDWLIVLLCCSPQHKCSGVSILFAIYCSDDFFVPSSTLAFSLLNSSFSLALRSDSGLGILQLTVDSSLRPREFHH